MVSEDVSQPGSLDSEYAPRMASDDERQRQSTDLIEWLDEKWTRDDKNCPVCEHNSWSVQGAFELRGFHGGSLVAGGDLQPVVPVICTNCGYTMLFNGVLTGVVESAAGTPATASDEADSPA